MEWHYSGLVDLMFYAQYNIISPKFSPIVALELFHFNVFVIVFAACSIHNAFQNVLYIWDDFVSFVSQTIISSNRILCNPWGSIALLYYYTYRD